MSDMDQDMRELMEVLCKAIVPVNKRKAVVRTHWHTPYYSRGRYTKL